MAQAPPLLGQEVPLSLQPRQAPPPLGGEVPPELRPPDLDASGRPVTTARPPDLDAQGRPQLTLTEFAQTIKAKYPEYASVPDADLVAKVFEKFPEYRERVQTGAAHVVAESEPGTYAAGFMKSVNDTVARTAGGIVRGAVAAVDPRTYYRANEAAGAEQERLLAAIQRDPSRFPHDAPSAPIREQLRAAAETLSSPEGGGEAIGGLAVGFVAPRVAPSVARGASTAGRAVADLPRPTAAQAMKAVKFARHPVIGAAKIAADELIRRYDQAQAPPAVAQAPGTAPAAAPPAPRSAPPTGAARPAVTVDDLPASWRQFTTPIESGPPLPVRDTPPAPRSIGAIANDLIKALRGPDKPHFTAAETVAGMDLMRRGFSTDEAIAAIVDQRAFLERFKGLPSTTARPPK